MGDDGRRQSVTTRGIMPAGLSDKPPAAAAPKDLAAAPCPEAEPGSCKADQLSLFIQRAETQFRKLRQAYHQNLAVLEAEIQRLTQALNAEKQEHQRTKNKLAEAQLEIDRLNLAIEGLKRTLAGLQRIANESAYDAHNIIVQGEETLARSAHELWQMVVEMYADLGIDIRTELGDKFRQTVAALGIPITTQDIQSLVEGLFSNETGAEERAGDRTTQVGHQSPHGQ